MPGSPQRPDSLPLTRPTTPPPGFEVTASRVAFSSAWNTVRIDTVRMPDGRQTQREIVEHMSAVGAVALDAEDRVLLLRQYRHAFGRRFLELPAGKLDVAGEDRVAAMQRELAEEVQVEAGRMDLLISYTNSAGWCTETTDVYLATDLREVPRPDGFELTHEEADMEVVRIPLEEAAAMVHRGEIVDSKTVIGLLALADRRRRAGL